MNIFDTMQTITKLAKAGMTLELQEKIAELREQVVALKEENTLLKEERLKLQQELDRYTKGALCPKCGKPSWALESSRPHPQLGAVGVLLRTYKCSDCQFSEDRTDNGRVNDR